MSDQIVHSYVIYIRTDICYCVSSSLKIDPYFSILVERIKTDSSDISH